MIKSMKEDLIENDTEKDLCKRYRIFRLFHLNLSNFVEFLSQPIIGSIGSIESNGSIG